MKLNDFVEVKLTTEGYAIYNNYCYRRYQISAPELPVFVFTLMNLMQIFGPHVYDGSKEIFENNEVICVERV